MTFRLTCAALVCVLALNVPAFAGKKSVDCGKGQSLNSAVQQASPGDTITFAGVCKENVTVLTSGITLAGDSNAAIQSPSSSQDALVINGAQRVTLTNFTVQNGANGIHAQCVAGIILQNITAQNNAVTGIFVAGDSSASISNSVALNNGVDGVDAEDSSSLIFTGSFTGAGKHNHRDQSRRHVERHAELRYDHGVSKRARNSSFSELQHVPWRSGLHD